MRYCLFLSMMLLAKGPVFGQPLNYKPCKGCGIPFFLEPVNPGAKNRMLYPMENCFHLIAGDVPFDSCKISVQGPAKISSFKKGVVCITPTIRPDSINPETMNNQVAVTIACPSRGINRTQNFWVCHSPDPEPLFGGRHRSGSMGNGEFKAQGGIGAGSGQIYAETEMCVDCKVESFSVIRIANGQAQTAENTGARFVEEARKLIDLAKPGDRYIFHKIRSKCPGDGEARELGSLFFEIK